MTVPVTPSAIINDDAARRRQSNLGLLSRVNRAYIAAIMDYVAAIPEPVAVASRIFDGDVDHDVYVYALAKLDRVMTMRFRNVLWGSGMTWMSATSHVRDDAINDITIVAAYISGDRKIG